MLEYLKLLWEIVTDVLLKTTFFGDLMISFLLNYKENSCANIGEFIRLRRPVIISYCIIQSVKRVNI